MNVADIAEWHRRMGEVERDQQIRAFHHGAAEKLHSVAGSGGETVSEWQWRSIDSVPKDGTHVLLWNAETKSVNVGYWQNIYTLQFHAVVLGHDALWNDDDGPQPIFAATHWMPLPAPPEGA